MRFLISNYSTPWFTEPYYFNAGINLIEGATSNLFDNQRSVYDNFDMSKPDIFVTHAIQLNWDIVHYLKNNHNIKIAININNVDDENISKINDFLKLQTIEPFFFGAKNSNVNGKFVKVSEAADIFLHSGGDAYRIEKLIFVEKPEDIIPVDYTCHYTSIKQELANIVDFILPINGLNSIFKNYDEIVFKGDFFIGSQISFNAIYSGTKVVFDSKESNSLDKIDDIFKNQKLLSSVKNRHTGLHRLKTLLSSLQCTELAKKVESELEKL
jgi:hypothetical protein